MVSTNKLDNVNKILLFKNLVRRSLLPQEDPGYIGWEYGKNFEGEAYWDSIEIGKDKENKKKFQIFHDSKIGYVLLVNDSSKGGGVVLRIDSGESRIKRMINSDYKNLKSLWKTIRKADLTRVQKEKLREKQVDNKVQDDIVKTLLSDQIEL